MVSRADARAVLVLGTVHSEGLDIVWLCIPCLDEFLEVLTGDEQFAEYGWVWEPL